MRDEKGRFIKGGYCSENWYEAVSKPHTEEHKKKISLAEKGRPSPMKGRKHSAETKLRMSINHLGKNKKGHPQTKATRAKISKASIGFWSNSDYRNKVLSRRKMSGLEKKFLDLIEKHNLPYKFVGDGKFYIERKCPDFVNTNGKKVAIEVFWKRHKDEFKGNTEKWMEDRSKLFAKYGWEIVYFEGAEINEKNILRKLSDDYIPGSLKKLNLTGERGF